MYAINELRLSKYGKSLLLARSQDLYLHGTRELHAPSLPSAAHALPFLCTVAGSLAAIGEQEVHTATG